MAKARRPVRVLLVEDNPADSELLLRELRRAGYEPDWTRVETEKDYLRQLDSGLDLILSDYSMPQFSGLRALQLLNERTKEIPFIIVSGTIGEETAVAAMRSGASDYLLKDRLTRLGQAVEQALEQKQMRQARRQTQETLERLRHHHELILNSAGEGIIGMDTDGSVIFENPKAAELLGWKPGELLGRPLHATIHHTQANGTPYPVESCPMHASLRDGGERRVTNDIFWRKKGTSFRVNFIAAGIKDARGRITGVIVTFQDVTEQFVAAMRLKLQEQQYRLIFESNPNPMWVFDTKTFQVLAVNDAAIAQYGYTREEFLQLSVLDLGSRNGRGAAKKDRSSEELAAEFSGELEYQKKDGSKVRVELYSGATVWTGVAARIVTAINITERRKAEARLRAQADIIDRAHDAIIIRNFEDRRVVFWNRGAERLYGWTSEEVVGTVPTQLFADPKHFDAILASLLATGEYHGTAKQVAKDGSVLTTEGRDNLVRNEDGTPKSILSICTDITEQKKLEAQLLRAQRLESIGTLASGVAHDLNNILTPILICAQTLREGVAQEDLDPIVSLIENSARRGASVVKQVLTFARGVEGERVLINPRHLIEEMLDIAQSTFPKSIELTSRYPEDLWSVESDPTQIHQVLLNLAVNARDAMPDGGRLELGVENSEVDEKTACATPGAKAGPYVVLRVTDSGSGMPQATLDKMFDPFFSTKAVGKGTGLGLSTSLGIVKSHGGFISVRSEQGKGTIFRVFLPAKLSDENVSSAQPSAGSLRGDGEQILAVDDEAAILSLVKLILEKNNYRVFTANDAAEAIAIFSEHKHSIHLVLTDMMMPHMSGGGLIRALQEVNPDQKFIASAGQGDEAHLTELQSLGVPDFLSKPYDQEKLLRTLRTALTRQR